MLHTLSNTFLFPQPQLLLPLTKDKRGKALDQGATLLNEAPLKSTGHHQEAGVLNQPWKLLQEWMAGLQAG